MFKATAVLSVALASGKNKYTFSQDTADLSLSVLRLLCWQSCWICILMQFGGRRKILGCLPELEELHRADFSASLGSPAKAGTDTPCLWCLCWEGGLWPALLVGLPGRCSEGEGGRPPPSPATGRGVLLLECRMETYTDVWCSLASRRVCLGGGVYSQASTFFLDHTGGT